MGWEAVTAVYSEPGRTCFETNKLTENGVDASPNGRPVTICYLNEDSTDSTCYAGERLIGTSVTPYGQSFSDWPGVCDLALIASTDPMVAVIRDHETPPPGIRSEPLRAG